MPHIRLSQFDYVLPKSRIAQKPIRPRDASKLMVVDRATKKITHRHFRDIVDLLRAGDILVVNDSKVIPARLLGTKDTGGSVEVLLVRNLSKNSWSVLLKNFKKSEIGKTITIGKNRPLHCTPIRKHTDGTWNVSFTESGKVFERRLTLHGKTPTPPYISASSSLGTYQTIYAKPAGSVAAPTAGFHFTKPLLAKLKKRGITLCTVTLHVGPGTFLPIRDDDVTKHSMQSEYATLSKQTAHCINAAKNEGRRIIAVGTTSVRVLESFADKKGVLHPGARDVNLFIYPGFRFKIVDALITNFHLPKSTLLLLVSAFAHWKFQYRTEARRRPNGLARAEADGAMTNGTPFVKECYAEAIKKKYRFYSFGDAMFID